MVTEGHGQGDVEASACVNPLTVDVTKGVNEVEVMVMRLDEMDMCEISSVNTDHHFCWDPRTVL